MSEKQVSDLIISIIMVATIVAIIVANPAIMQRSGSRDHAETGAQL